MLHSTKSRLVTGAAAAAILSLVFAATPVVQAAPMGGMMKGMTKSKKMGAAPAAGAKRTVVSTCPITGGKVVGMGAGMSVVENYEVHFCCAGCKPMFDKMTKAQQLAKIKAVI